MSRSYLVSVITKTCGVSLQSEYYQSLLASLLASHITFFPINLKGQTQLTLKPRKYLELAMVMSLAWRNISLIKPQLTVVLMQTLVHLVSDIYLDSQQLKQTNYVRGEKHL